MNWACFGCRELRSNGPIFCDVIKLIGDMTRVKPYMSEAVIIIDSVAIHKGTCYVRRVDYGTGLSEAQDYLATEALVFRIVVLLVIGSTQLYTSYRTKFQHQSKHS